MNTNNIKFFVIEGNIGSGKSYFLEKIKCFLENQQEYKFIFLSEPIDDWIKTKDVFGKSVFEKFNLDMSLNSFLFQLVCNTSRQTQLYELSEKLKTLEDGKWIILFERSLLSGQNIFAKNLLDKKLLSQSEYDFLKKNFIFKIDLNYFFLDIPFTTCFNNIKNRNRDSEKFITLDYLYSLELLYKNEFKNFKKIDYGTTVESFFQIIKSFF